MILLWIDLNETGKMKTLRLNRSIFYQSADTQVKLDLWVRDGSIWLNQLEIAKLFRTTKQNISLHVKNILEKEELCRNTVVREFPAIQSEGKRLVRRHLTYYNLDLILAIGDRLSTLQGVWFRQWADTYLKEFLHENIISDNKRCIFI